MPKKLFFEIDEQKKNRIIAAASKEFSQRKYADASINQIIKESNISRGSFYQYFEDKDDLYFYMVNTIVSETAFSFVKKFAPQADDIFSVYESLFRYNLQIMSDEKYQMFFRNLYFGMDYHIQQKLKEIFSSIREKMMEGKLNELRLKSGYSTLCFEELMNILELNNRDLLMQYIAHPMDADSIMEIYQRRIQVLQGIKSTDSERKSK